MIKNIKLIILAKLCMISLIEECLTLVTTFFMENMLAIFMFWLISFFLDRVIMLLPLDYIN